MSALRNSRSRRARRARRGDTLIEVMVALVVATVGMVGIASLQGSTVRSNQDSQEIGVALSFGRTWIQRIKRDALSWQAPGNPNVGTMLAGRNIGLGLNYFVPNGAWGLPVPLPALESSGANNRGIDIGAPVALNAPLPVVPAGALHYCVNTRFLTVQNTTDGLPEKIEAFVRVWWARRGSADSTNHNNASLTDLRTAGRCIVLQGPELNSTDLRVLYLSTPLRYTR